MSAHTAAPWEACEQGDYNDFGGKSRVILGDDMRIAVVHWDDSSPERKAESDANAVLMAASPTLLEVCQAQHNAIDELLAWRIEHDRGFLPSKWARWPVMMDGAKLIAKLRGEP